mmetsp:Transcript_22152/g.44596  ORF Transcript_22152/g.44596 Transcript_22152/m.44596 type:complete len:207 (-) Transcript_22152:373-993(-)
MSSRAVVASCITRTSPSASISPSSCALRAAATYVRKKRTGTPLDTRSAGSFRPRGPACCHVSSLMTWKNMAFIASGVEAVMLSPHAMSYSPVSPTSTYFVRSGSLVFWSFWKLSNLRQPLRYCSPGTHSCRLPYSTVASQSIPHLGDPTPNRSNSFSAAAWYSCTSFVVGLSARKSFSSRARAVSTAMGRGSWLGGSPKDESSAPN